MDTIPLWRTDLRYWPMAGVPVIERQRLFFGVLMTGMFVTYAYQRAVNLNQNDERFASVCQMVVLITVGLLLVGVWNAPVSSSKRGCTRWHSSYVYWGKFCCCVCNIWGLTYQPARIDALQQYGQQ